MFTQKLLECSHGHNLKELVQPKSYVAMMARDFAGNHLPEEAVDVAEVAHLAELISHENLGRNVRRSLASGLEASIADLTPEDLHDDEAHASLRYRLALLSDFPIIASFSRSHEEMCQAKGRDYVDLNGLVDLVEKTNFESIIIKSALDHSNFLLLTGKSSLNPQEEAKLKRIITAIKTVDSPLLGLTGFDALEAEILSKTYSWELRNTGGGYFVDAAENVFEQLGGRQHLAATAEQFLEELFTNDQFTHDRVTADQHDYGVFFSDGSVSLKSNDNEEYRVLSRLKSVGATAKKMHKLHQKTGELEVPMDIIGITLIAKDKEEMSNCLEGLFERLSSSAVRFQAAPSRREHVHIKGRPDFIALFGEHGSHASTYATSDLTVQDEACDNGYEAVKITLIHDTDGRQVPIEIQVTHETARKEGRVGSGNHTIFKLMKLAEDGENVSVTELSTEEQLESFSRLSVRKRKFDKISYEVNGESRERASKLLHRLQQSTSKSLAAIALQR